MHEVCIPGLGNPTNPYCSDFIKKKKIKQNPHRHTTGTLHSQVHKQEREFQKRKTNLAARDISPSLPDRLMEARVLNMLSQEGTAGVSPDYGLVILHMESAGRKLTGEQ